METLPASYFGLEREVHTRLRVVTKRLGETDPRAPNPVVLAGFDVAALDPGDREPDADRWNAELVDLYRTLIETKVFTAAKPLMVIWNADAGTGKPTWSLGVPVAEGTEVKPPLVRQHVPAMTVHVHRGTAREILKKFGGRKEENPTVWTFVGNVRRAAGSGLTRPAILMLRFPDWELADLDDDSDLEVLFGEPAAAASQGAETEAVVGRDPAMP